MNVVKFQNSLTAAIGKVMKTLIFSLNEQQKAYPLKPEGLNISNRELYCVETLGSISTYQIIFSQKTSIKSGIEVFVQHLSIQSQ